jgi:flagellar basal-body rod protein FlgG
MNTSMISSASAMRAAQARLDTIGNNMANVNTNGFKGREVTFGSVLANQFRNLPEGPQEGNRMTPNLLDVGYGSMVASTRYDFTPGTPQETQQDTDMYINGDGFFRVLHQGTQGTEVHYTRMGAFATRPDASGNGDTILTTAQGDTVLDNQGQAITIPSGYKLQLGSHGGITFINKGNPNDTIQGPQLGLYRVLNHQQLAAVGADQYSTPAANVQAAGADVTVKQGFLEASNVDLAKEMTALTETQRVYQLNARALSFMDQMSSIVNDINGR